MNGGDFIFGVKNLVWLPSKVGILSITEYIVKIDIVVLNE